MLFCSKLLYQNPSLCWLLFDLLAAAAHAWTVSCCSPQSSAVFCWNPHGGFLKSEHFAMIQDFGKVRRGVTSVLAKQDAENPHVWNLYMDSLESFSRGLLTMNRPVLSMLDAQRVYRRACARWLTFWFTTSDFVGKLMAIILGATCLIGLK